VKNKKYFLALIVVIGLILSVLLVKCGGGGRETAPVASSTNFVTFSVAGVTSTINNTNNTVEVTMPYGTRVNALIAAFQAPGAKVTVEDIPQISGKTINDFSKPVVYKVTAADGTTKEYTVKVTVALRRAKAITEYSFSGLASGTIDEKNKTIMVVLPFGTNVSSLIATFTTTGASVKINEMEQVSGTTANDFSDPLTHPVIYKVTAFDGSSANYTVTVAVANNFAKEMKSFSLAGVNANLNESDKTITIKAPVGTNVKKLVAVFNSTGHAVKVGGVEQVSGTTENDFTKPLVYKVLAADGTSIDYTVTVNVALAPPPAIVDFTVSGIAGKINESDKSITVALPFGANETSLSPKYTIKSMVGGSAVLSEVSFSSPADFTNPVTISVPAEDGSKVEYKVNVTVGLNPAKSITAFTLSGANARINEANKTIAVNVPYNTDLKTLIATFKTTGVKVAVGQVEQISGTTPNDFTTTVTYTVTAEDGSTVDYKINALTLPPVMHSW
jgi:hypothetical protein